MAPPAPAFDARGVSPNDTVITLRSLRRRFAEAFEQAESPGDLAQRTAGGLSPLEHAAWTATALATIGSALRMVLISDHPDVELPPIDPPRPPTGGNGDPADVLARLGDTARTVADAMADVHGDDWARAGQARTGEVSALDIARLGVRIAIEHLRAVEGAITPGRA